MQHQVKCWPSKAVSRYALSQNLKILGVIVEVWSVLKRNFPTYGDGVTLCDQNSSSKWRQWNSVGCQTVHSNHYSIYSIDKLVLDGDNSHTHNTTAMTHKPHLLRAMHINLNYRGQRIITYSYHNIGQSCGCKAAIFDSTMLPWNENMRANIRRWSVTHIWNPYCWSSPTKKKNPQLKSYFLHHHHNGERFTVDKNWIR